MVIIHLFLLFIFILIIISIFILPVPSALQGLIDHIDRDLTFALETEHGKYGLNIQYVTLIFNFFMYISLLRVYFILVFILFLVVILIRIIR